MVTKRKDAGENLYPHKFFVQISLEEFIERYNHIEDGDILEEEVTVAGKVHVSRSHAVIVVFRWNKKDPYQQKCTWSYVSLSGVGFFRVYADFRGTEIEIYG